MPRKPPKGYFVQGHFVAYGSEEDAELKRAAKWDAERSKTDLKKQSAHLQTVGEQLLTLKAPLLQRLALPDALLDAIAQAKRIDDFEGRRRQLQYIGKLMRQLDEGQVTAIEAAVAEQHRGSAAETQRLHEAERWRERLLADDTALDAWRDVEPQADWQRLRALVRQARKDAEARPDAAPGQAQRQGRAYRELFQYVRAALDARADSPLA
ncbi:MAG: ribosome biogenesis factor YjgA [Tepidimonas sp.]|uniref:ribosome biogenesis factor YjgA n=1 Tax=Tepidimonas sp. TaxID=2002775 RepID=UPI00259F82E3|nr:ribosome biogenesis factor YjgA [Tepidimonas sp.]MDM7455910.1 ribosome biogenesis factor YjgA [Tepidimonas sp.]